MASIAAGALLSAFVWGQTTRFGFVWDDTFFVVRNTALRSWSNLPAFFYDAGTSADQRSNDFLVFRPLRNISYLIDFKVAGLDPAWWHLHQVLLHTLNAGLVGLAAGLLARRRLAGLVGGLIFLVHPVQTEAVAWVKGRDDLLSAFWMLLGFLLWLRGRRAPWGWARSAALAAVYGLACLAKEQAIVLPLLLWMAERWIPVGAASSAVPEARAGHRPWILLIGVGLIYLLWRHAFLGRTSQTAYLDGPIATWLTMLPVALRYVQLLVFPYHLLADYDGMAPCRSPLDPSVLVAVPLLAMLILLIWLGRRRWPEATYGLAWVGVALLPVANIVPMMQYIAERFLYMPMIGFACAAGALAARAAARHRLIAGLICAALIAAGAWQARLRAAVWKDEVTLFGTTVRDAPPTCIRARRNFAAALIRAEDFAAAKPLAEELWKAAVTNPVESPRRKAEYAHQVGLIALRTGDALTGRAMLTEAIALDPTFVEPRLTLAIAAGVEGDHAAALRFFDQTLAMAPGLAAAHYNRGICLQQLGRNAEAEQALRKAIACVPEDPGAHKALAAMLWQRGDIQAAQTVYREALRLWPNDAVIRHWLTKAREQTGAR